MAKVWLPGGRYQPDLSCTPPGRVILRSPELFVIPPSLCPSRGSHCLPSGDLTQESWSPSVHSHLNLYPMFASRPCTGCSSLCRLWVLICKVHRPLSIGLHLAFLLSMFLACGYIGRTGNLCPFHLCMRKTNPKYLPDGAQGSCAMLSSVSVGILLREVVGGSASSATWSFLHPQGSSWETPDLGCSPSPSQVQRLHHRWESPRMNVSPTGCGPSMRQKDKARTKEEVTMIIRTQGLGENRGVVSRMVPMSGV